MIKQYLGRHENTCNVYTYYAIVVTVYVCHGHVDGITVTVNLFKACACNWIVFLLLNEEAEV
jgi:hypothetical protein